MENPVRSLHGTSRQCKVERGEALVQQTESILRAMVNRVGGNMRKTSVLHPGRETRSQGMLLPRPSNGGIFEQVLSDLKRDPGAVGFPSVKGGWGEAAEGSVARV